SPVFRGDGNLEGIVQLGRGHVALHGLPLALFCYFDRRLAELGAAWRSRPVLTPSLIPALVLARCDYFRSFPHNVTFACHLREDSERIDSFRSRHHDRQNLDDAALTDMATPEACLSPAVCYHVYQLYKDKTVPAAGLAFGVCGKCFRYESSN